MSVDVNVVFESDPGDERGAKSKIEESLPRDGENDENGGEGEENND